MSENITVKSPCELVFGGVNFRCSIGRKGITNNKKEGDGTTPAGCFSIRGIMYRADRIEKPRSVFPVREITENDGWCDDPKDEKYNQYVKLPYKSHTERLWRDDEIYDVILVLGFNDNPVVSGAGSAIFMHLARPGYSATDGCIALNKKDLLEIINNIKNNTLVCVE